jgi:Cdc6-like AAA superfamily ATPase
MAGGMEPLAHQQAALDEIVRRGRAYFAGGWLELPVVPRWPTLMTGPTGTGKTAVAKMAAETLSTELSGKSVSTLIIATP